MGEQMRAIYSLKLLTIKMGKTNKNLDEISLNFENFASYTIPIWLFNSLCFFTIKNQIFSVGNKWTAG